MTPTSEDDGTNSGIISGTNVGTNSGATSGFSTPVSPGSPTPQPTTRKSWMVYPKGDDNIVREFFSDFFSKSEF
jgi:hypothetical protein